MLKLKTLSYKCHIFSQLNVLTVYLFSCLSNLFMKLSYFSSWPFWRKKIHFPCFQYIFCAKEAASASSRGVWWEELERHRWPFCWDPFAAVEVFPRVICSNQAFCVCSVAQACLTLCDPMDCSPLGSSIHGIFQARILEWVAISFSRGSSWSFLWPRKS